MEKAERLERTTYDQVPYLGLSHALTHPDVLATAGRLLGLDPPDIKNCRVLELGCAAGSNLIPMACCLPGSRFTGLDSSRIQIDQGRQAVITLGLANIELKYMDILDVDASLGLFDYIIVHGIFSWVPEKVKDKILEICDRNLSPAGIAYVSYNTYPGWHQQKIVRDMMLYYTRSTAEPGEKIRRARTFLEFMADSSESMVKQSKSQFAEIYVGILKHENERLKESEDSYLFHEELEEANDPLYFHQFADWAGRHNLQYLSEASLSKVFMNDVPSEIREKLVGMAGDIIELEQFRDFLTNRYFRTTLLVHKDLRVSRHINTDRVSNLLVGSGCLPVSSNPDITGRSIEQFVSPDESKMATDHPVTKAAMLYLSRIWPQVITVDELLEKAYALLRQAMPEWEMPLPASAEVRAQDMQTLRANLLKGFVSSPMLVEFHVYAPFFAALPGDHPAASPWARFQVMAEAAERNPAGDKKRPPFTVTNLRHERIELSELDLFLLYLLDGSRSRDELLVALTEALENNNPAISASVNSGEAISQVKKDPVKDLDAALRGLARAALLIA